MREIENLIKPKKTVGKLLTCNRDADILINVVETH